MNHAVQRPESLPGRLYDHLHVFTAGGIGFEIDRVGAGPTKRCQTGGPIFIQGRPSGQNQTSVVCPRQVAGKEPAQFTGAAGDQIYALIFQKSRFPLHQIDRSDGPNVSMVIVVTDFRIERRFVVTGFL